MLPVEGPLESRQERFVDRAVGRGRSQLVALPDIAAIGEAQETHVVRREAVTRELSGECRFEVAKDGGECRAVRVGARLHDGAALLVGHVGRQQAESRGEAG